MEDRARVLEYGRGFGRRPVRRCAGVIALLLSLTMATYACAPAESPAPDPAPTREDDRAAIDALMDGLEAAYANGDIELLMSVYTEDLIYMGAASPAVRGAADFRVANDPVGAYNLVMQNDEVQLSGDWGYARGTYDGNDRYLMLVRREADGQWRIAREIWNIAPDDE